MAVLSWVGVRIELRSKDGAYLSETHGECHKHKAPQE